MLTCLVEFVMLLSTALTAPLVNKEIRTDGCSLGSAHYALYADDYTVNKYLQNVTVRGAFSQRPAKYYSVTVNKGPLSGREMMVCVTADKATEIDSGTTVNLYGTISQGHATFGGRTTNIYCLNDSGDTVVGMWLKSCCFLAIAGVAIYLQSRITKKLK